MRCVVVIPTYNEAATLGDLLATLESDGTADLVRAHPGFGDGVHLLPRAAKDDLGPAYRAASAAFAGALSDGYDVIVHMDADGSHPPNAIPTMVTLLGSNDLVIGSRYVSGGRLTEHAITSTERTAGASKMSFGVAVEAVPLIMRRRTRELVSRVKQLTPSFAPRTRVKHP